MKTKFLFLIVPIILLLTGIAVFVFVYFYPEKTIEIITKTVAKPGKAKNIKYTLFTHSDYANFDAWDNDSVKYNAALLITDSEEIKEAQELFLAEQHIAHSCGYHYKISFWYDTDSIYSLNYLNKECEVFSYEPKETRHRLDYYAKKLETSPTHYIYVIEFKPNEEKFFFNDSNLKLFIHKEEYQEKSIIHLLDTSPNIDEVKGKLKQYRFIKEITEYKVD